MKIMLYTHNSAGFGHAVRTAALLSAMKKTSRSIDFLVVSGTSAPEIFLRQGIEVVKLPSTKLSKTIGGWQLKPKLTKQKTAALFELREKIISVCFEEFQPDVLIVDHSLYGQAGELVPILVRKWRRKQFQQQKPITVFIHRGVIDSSKRIRVEWEKKEHLIESINVSDLYDLVYVLDYKENTEYGKIQKEFTNRIKFLGPITIKTKKELIPSEIVKKEEGILQNKKIILLALGQSSLTKKITVWAREIIKKIDKQNEYKIINRPSPLNENQPSASFDLSLIDLINASDLVIARAGYNICAETLLTNSKAVLIANTERTKEQLVRANKVKSKNIVFLNDKKLNRQILEKAISKKLKEKTKDEKYSFNKYKIAKVVLKDIEALLKKEAELNAKEN